MRLSNRMSLVDKDIGTPGPGRHSQTWDTPTSDSAISVSVSTITDVFLGPVTPRSLEGTTGYEGYTTVCSSDPLSSHGSSWGKASLLTFKYGQKRIWNGVHRGEKRLKLEIRKCHYSDWPSHYGKDSRHSGRLLSKSDPHRDLRGRVNIWHTKINVF